MGYNANGNFIELKIEDYDFYYQEEEYEGCLYYSLYNIFKYLSKDETNRLIPKNIKDWLKDKVDEKHYFIDSGINYVPVYFISYEGIKTLYRFVLMNKTRNKDAMKLNYKKIMEIIRPLEIEYYIRITSENINFGYYEIEEGLKELREEAKTAIKEIKNELSNLYWVNK